jgi:hypothetical protein
METNCFSYLLRVSNSLTIYNYNIIQYSCVALFYYIIFLNRNDDQFIEHYATIVTKVMEGLKFAENQSLCIQVSRFSSLLIQL